MIRWLAFMLLGLSTLAASAAIAPDTYSTITGEEYTGIPKYPDPRGVFIQQADDTSKLVGWTNFTQTALKKLSIIFAKNPQAMRFIEPLLDEEDPPDSKPRAATPPVTYRPPPFRLDKPSPKAGIGDLFASPVMVLLFFLVYAGNIYAAYEISLFRNQSPVLVCGVAAVAPLIGPAIFLSIPTRIPIEEPPTMAEIAAEHAAAPVPVLEMATAASQSAQGAGEQGAGGGAAPVVFQRGTTSFNRRFFETKLAGFLRMVPGEAEKDMVVWVKSARGEHAGPRITRALPNELQLHVTKGGASQDVIIPYSEILEIRIRHKDEV